MSVVISLGSAVAMVMFASAIYNLQWWLEQQRLSSAISRIDHPPAAARRVKPD